MDYGISDILGYLLNGFLYYSVFGFGVCFVD